MSYPTLSALLPERLPDMELPGYLHRWVLQPGQAPVRQRSFLHNILAPDHPELHSHPWKFRTLVLRGGYRALEYVREGSNRIRMVSYRAGDRYAFPGGQGACAYHTIVDVDAETWTLVEPGVAQLPDWGYLVLPDQVGPQAGMVVDGGTTHVDTRDYVYDPPRPAPIFRHGYRPRWYFEDTTEARQRQASAER